MGDDMSNSTKHFYLEKNLKYVCMKCLTMFDSEDIFDKHVLDKHNPLHDTAECTKTDVKAGYLCAKCAKVLKTLSALKSHMKAHELCETKSKQLKSQLDNTHKKIDDKVSGYYCVKCDKVLKKTISFKNHVKRHESAETKNSILFPCKECNFTSHFKPEIRAHYSSAHGHDLTPRKLEFKNIEEFYTWKQEICIETKSIYKMAYFTKNRSTKNLFKFSCHRDGFYKTRLIRQRNLKANGSNKINGHCPAEMRGSIEHNSSVIVHFIETHVGHNMDPERFDIDNVKKKSLTALTRQPEFTAHHRKILELIEYEEEIPIYQEAMFNLEKMLNEYKMLRAKEKCKERQKVFRQLKKEAKHASNMPKEHVSKHKKKKYPTDSELDKEACSGILKSMDVLGDDIFDSL